MAGKSNILIIQEDDSTEDEEINTTSNINTEQKRTTKNQSKDAKTGNKKTTEHQTRNPSEEEINTTSSKNRTKRKKKKKENAETGLQYAIQTTQCSTECYPPEMPAYQPQPARLYTQNHSMNVYPQPFNVGPILRKTFPPTTQGYYPPPGTFSSQNHNNLQPLLGSEMHGRITPSNPSPRYIPFSTPPPQQQCNAYMPPPLFQRNNTPNYMPSPNEEFFANQPPLPQQDQEVGICEQLQPISTRPQQGPMSSLPFLGNDQPRGSGKAKSSHPKRRSNQVGTAKIVSRHKESLELVSESERQVFNFLLSNRYGIVSLDNLMTNCTVVPKEKNEAVAWIKSHDTFLKYLTLKGDMKCLIPFHPKMTFCLNYDSRRGCSKETCNNIHMCRWYIYSNHCKRGSECPYSHSLHDNHNQSYIERIQVANYPDKQLFSLLRNRYPRICSIMEKTKICKRKECIHLHMCYNFITGKCKDPNVCGRPHSFDTEHNKTILNMFKMTGFSRKFESRFKQLLYKATMGTRRYPLTTQKRSKSTEGLDDWSDTLSVTSGITQCTISSAGSFADEREHDFDDEITKSDESGNDEEYEEYEDNKEETGTHEGLEEITPEPSVLVSRSARFRGDVHETEFMDNIYSYN